MKSLACATALTLCSMAALAQDGMAAKSLFFGSDGSVMSVPTTAQGAAAVANAPKAVASGTKVASATPKKPAGLGRRLLHPAQEARRQHAGRAGQPHLPERRAVPAGRGR